MRKHIFIFLATAMLFASLNACSDETSAKSESTDTSAVSDDSFDNVSATVTDDVESAVTDSVSTSMTEESDDDGTIAPEVYYICTHYHDDENGNCVHRLRETVSEDETILNEEIYAYDKNNRKITEKRYRNGELTTELVFEYV